MQMRHLLLSFWSQISFLEGHGAKGIYASSCEQHRSVPVAVRIGCRGRKRKMRQARKDFTVDCVLKGRSMSQLLHALHCKNATALCSTLLHLCIADCKAHYKSPSRICFLIQLHYAVSSQLLEEGMEDLKVRRSVFAQALEIHKCSSIMFYHTVAAVSSQQAFYRWVANRCKNDLTAKAAAVKTSNIASAFQIIFTYFQNEHQGSDLIWRILIRSHLDPFGIDFSASDESASWWKAQSSDVCSSRALGFLKYPKITLRKESLRPRWPTKFDIRNCKKLQPCSTNRAKNQMYSPFML